MYGRMQFADFVVSAALQALTRGLKKVGQTSTAGSALAASDEKGLLLNVRKILSLHRDDKRKTD